MQPREPRGRPVGGRFKETKFQPSGLSLGTLVVATPEDEIPAYDPLVRVEDVYMMLRPTQNLTTRLAAARVPYQGVAGVAAQDPHPLVRATALINGWDLEDDSRAVLEDDPAIVGILNVLQHGPR